MNWTSHKPNILIIVLIAVIGLAAAYYYTLGFISFLPYVSIVRGEAAMGYIGRKTWEASHDFDVNVDLSQLDLTSYGNVSLPKSKLSVTMGARPPKKDLLVLTSFRPIANSPAAQEYLLILKPDSFAVESFPFPEVSWGGVETAKLAWVGQDIFLTYFSRSSFDIPGKQSFYRFNTENKAFDKLTVDKSILYHLVHAGDINILQSPNFDGTFAISYCARANFLGECSKYGFALSDSKEIRHAFTLRTTGDFQWGWHQKELFVSSGSSVVLVDPQKLSWSD